jgi:3-oxoacyl-[acyl-carrier-protein] synthase II
MTAFINGLSAVSPQKTFSGEVLQQEAINYRGVNYIKCIDPVVSEFIDPMASRRMSRIIKLGVCSALKCLNDAGIKNPDGIITGTGLGCIEDTEKFLRSLHSNNEKLLNPTPFIQSTHNTVSSTIAIMIKCNNYNSTYVHRGNSFENAITDGIMLLNENSAENILVGGLDELTDDSFYITNRLGFWKKEPVDTLNLLDYKSKGTLAGEGMTFLALSSKRNEKSFAGIEMPETFFKPESYTEVESRIAGYIKRTVGDIGNIDLVIMGLNGDFFSDEVYYNAERKLFGGIPCAYYKHLCGEYDTSASFATFMAAEIIKKQYVPAVMRLDDKPIDKIRNILVYNHLRNVNHSLILLSLC